MVTQTIEHLDLVLLRHSSPEPQGTTAVLVYKQYPCSHFVSERHKNIEFAIYSGIYCHLCRDVDV